LIGFRKLAWFVQTRADDIFDQSGVRPARRRERR